jgi:predicted AAA+ superfamily ATPase
MSEIRTATALYPRQLLGPLEESLRDAPVVSVVGARQVGKSTLVREVIRRGHRAEYISLDDPGVRRLANADPRGFLARFPGKVVIDEVQLAPELFPAIKLAVDEDRRPGRFILTGSANVLTLPRVSESLAGRTEIHTLWPLSQGEIEKRHERFVDRVFEDELPRVVEKEDVRADTRRRALLGGYPEVLRRRPSARAAWFRSYVETVVQRTAREVSQIERVADLPRILATLAGRPASILNRAELSRTLGMNAKTLDRYLTILHQIFLIHLLPAWHQNIGKRAAKHPKVLLVDTGLLGFLSGVSVERFVRDPTLAGSLLENFVAVELLKQIGWSTESPSLNHFRTHEGDEVDLVLERRDGTLVGIEVKASATVESSDFRGLRTLLLARPKKVVRGIVLYTGLRSVDHAPGLVALPMSAIWKL